MYLCACQLAGKGPKVLAGGSIHSTVWRLSGACYFSMHLWPVSLLMSQEACLGRQVFVVPLAHACAHI